jgi:hypothetical protein
MQPQTRLGPRVPILGHVGGDITVVEPLAVKELGTGGATIETRFPLLIDSLHELRLALADRTVVVKGRVVHSHISDVDADVVAYQSGIEFVEAPHHVQDAIAAYLDTIRSARSGLSSP